VTQEPWSERMIARAISTQLLNRKCIVLVPNTKWTGYECDVLGVTMDLRIIDIEVKISRADLKIDAHKDKWWIRYHGWGLHGPEQMRGFPPKVWKHYYAMPADIWKPELEKVLPSPNSGILLLQHSRNVPSGVAVNCVRRATPNRDCDRLSPEDALDIARLANLRMHEMAAELESLRRQQNVGTIAA
jgi:hypothetical protein